MSTEMLPSEPALAEHIFGGYYRVSSKPVGVTTRAASAASAMTAEMRAHWLLEETLLDRLSQDLEAMALALGQLIQTQDAMVRQEHLPRQGPRAAADQAQSGILFLDALPEGKRDALDVLRRPLEDGVVTIARTSVGVTFPARLTLVGAMNPYP